MAKNPTKARVFINKDSLKEALTWINVALEVYPENQNFEYQRNRARFKEGNTWDSIKSKQFLIIYTEGWHIAFTPTWQKMIMSVWKKQNVSKLIEPVATIIWVSLKNAQNMHPIG